MYKTIKTVAIVNSNTNLSKSAQRLTKTAIEYEGKIVAYIPDYFKEPESIANGICEILNTQRKIILNLDI